MDADKAQVLVLMGRLLNIIVDEFGDDVPDHILLDHGEHVYRTVVDTVAYVQSHGVDPSVETMLLIGRFHRAAKNEGWLEDQPDK